MKKILKIFAFTLLSAVILSVGLSVYADVIVEPRDDFFDEHQDECVYNNSRQYVVNTDKGYAYLYVDPESSLTIKGYSNGEAVRISWLYTDKSGEVWGVLSWETGWFRMSDLTVVYDGYSFIEDHGHEFEEYVQGSYNISVSEDDPVEVWQYPGKRLNFSYGYSDINGFISQTYTDEEGIVWGYISYLVGSRNVWVCLSGNESDIIEESEVTVYLKADPVVPEPTPDEKPTVTVNGEVIDLKAEPVPQDQIPANPEHYKTLIIVGVLVGGVVVITAVAIVIYGKKRASNDSVKE